MTMLDRTPPKERRRASSSTAAPAKRRRWRSQQDRVRPFWLGEVLIIVFLLTIYDRIKDLVGPRTHDAFENARGVLRIEEFLYLHIEQSANHWLAGHYWLGVVASWWYEFAWASCAFILLGICYWSRPWLYRAARNCMVMINAVGLLVFFLLPVAPPRLLPGANYHDTVALSGFGSTHDGALPAAQYAAMPSLHLGWATFTAILLWRMTSRRWLRAVAVAYPFVTAVVVVTSANHYVLDVLAGAGLALLSALVTGLWPGVRRHLTERVTPQDAEQTQPPVEARVSSS
jgi:membrane-associated phospholipid phosphatase